MYHFSGIVEFYILIVRRYLPLIYIKYFPKEIDDVGEYKRDEHVTEFDECLKECEESCDGDA